MKILTPLRLYVVLITLLFLILFINYMSLKEELNKCQTNAYYVPGGDIEKSELLTKVDSLQQEIFIKDIEIGSYEVMWGMLEEVNRPLADSINLQVE